MVTEERDNIDEDAKPFARKTKEIGRQGLREGASLVEVVCLNAFNLNKLCVPEVAIQGCLGNKSNVWVEMDIFLYW